MMKKKSIPLGPLVSTCYRNDVQRRVLIYNIVLYYCSRVDEDEN